MTAESALLRVPPWEVCPRGSRPPGPDRCWLSSWLCFRGLLYQITTNPVARKSRPLFSRGAGGQKFNTQASAGLRSLPKALEGNPALTLTVAGGSKYSLLRGCDTPISASASAFARLLSDSSLPLPFSFKNLCHWACGPPTQSRVPHLKILNYIFKDTVS